MSYTHCDRCRGLVMVGDRHCRICRQPLAGDAVETNAVPTRASAPGPVRQIHADAEVIDLDAFERGAAHLAIGAAATPSGARHGHELAASAPGRVARTASRTRPLSTSASASATPPKRAVPARRVTAAEARVLATPSVLPPPPPPPPPAPPAARRAISVEGLTKVFGDGALAVPAIRGVTFDVFDGEVVLIMGPSGSGKTTLLLMLGAMLRPTAGSVQIGGTEVSTTSERRLPKLRATHLGFVFQDFNLLSALTAIENVELACNLAGVKGKAATTRSAALLQRVGLGHRMRHRPEQLSGGEKQRVAIARALANDPPLLLADEPTANLDSAHGRDVGQLLRRLADEDGRTSLIVTHDDRLTGIADRVLWLEDGTLHDGGRR